MDYEVRKDQLFKRLVNMQSDFMLCVHKECSKYLKKFTESWIYKIYMLGSTDKNKTKKQYIKPYEITINLDGNIICDCPDFLFQAKKHNIVCKHILFILNFDENINIDFLLNNNFKLEKKMLNDLINILDDSFNCELCNKKVLYNSHIINYNNTNNDEIKFLDYKIDKSKCHNECIQLLESKIFQ